jgi:hypothetical protein
MINLADNAILMRCDCGSADHLAFLKDDGDGEWYLTVLLDPIFPWWRRLWRALRPHGRFGPYAEIVLKGRRPAQRRVCHPAPRGALELKGFLWRSDVRNHVEALVTRH